MSNASGWLWSNKRWGATIRKGRPMTDSDHRAAIAGVLAEHRSQGHWQQNDVPGLSHFVSQCSCGSRDGHAIHLADVHVNVMPERYLSAMWDCATYLRERANRLSNTEGEPV
jgi:hypothetical protein